MQSQIIAMAAAALPPPQAPSFIKTAAITGLIVFVVGFVVVLQGMKITHKADKQEVAKSAKITANVVIGLCLVVAGLGLPLLAWVMSALGFIAG